MSQRQFTLLSLLLFSVLSSNSLNARDELAVITTAQGNQLQIVSQLSPLEINRIHSWELRLTDSDGTSISNAEIEISGGMPEHDHGMPTLPRVTGVLENGGYLLQGVRFHMPGFWQLVFTIKTANGTDSAELEFTL